MSRGIMFDITFHHGLLGHIVCRNCIGFIVETIDESLKSRFSKFIDTAKDDSNKIDFHRIYITITSGPETILDHTHHINDERFHYIIDYNRGCSISFQNSIVKEVKETFNTTIFEKLKQFGNNKIIKFSGSIDLTSRKASHKEEE